MGRGGVIVGYYMLVGLLCGIMCYIYILVDNIISSWVYIYHKAPYYVDDSNMSISIYIYMMLL